MKAVILAAGEGVRMRPLTHETPKSLVRVRGKSLLHHIWEALPEEIDEVLLVIASSFKGGMIRAAFGPAFGGKRVTYVVQEKPLGTGHALSLCRSRLGADERFLFLLGDDLHGKQSLAEMVRHPLAILVHPHPDPRRFGVVEVGPGNRVASFEEKPAAPKSNLVSPGVFVLDPRVFKYPLPIHEESGEYFLTPQVAAFMKEHPFAVVRSDFWIPIATPEDLARAEEILRSRETR